MVWDGATIHRSQAIKDFLKRKPGRIHLVALPGYSPELNPVELLWNQLKKELKNQAFLNLKDLVEAAVSKVEEIRNDVELLNSFFHKKEVAFFTN
ncbi:transposase [Salmonirosea aquatica]|uniref:transposase n=1 Tax=Salmonirosea aquatica TaxID=2654236 RepID=UPI003570D69E